MEFHEYEAQSARMTSRLKPKQQTGALGIECDEIFYDKTLPFTENSLSGITMLLVECTMVFRPIYVTLITIESRVEKMKAISRTDVRSRIVKNVNLH